MKVYVITSGEYSDYGIEAVCLDKDKAEQICATINEGLIRAKTIWRYGFYRRI